MYCFWWFFLIEWITKSGFSLVWFQGRENPKSNKFGIRRNLRKRWTWITVLYNIGRRSQHTFFLHFPNLSVKNLAECARIRKRMSTQRAYSQTSKYMCAHANTLTNSLTHTLTPFSSNSERAGGRAMWNSKNQRRNHQMQRKIYTKKHIHT